jgi:hypothetical protein
MKETKKQEIRSLIKRKKKNPQINIYVSGELYAQTPNDVGDINIHCDKDCADTLLKLRNINHNEK